MQSEHKVEVLIIGGGVSGLVTGKTLSEAGINDYVILEAQDRVGGRINTIDHGDHVVEMGAQWIHGEDNRLYEFAKEHQLICDAPSYEAEGLFFTGKGEKVPEKLIEEMRDLYEDWYERCNDFARKDTAGPRPASVGHFFKQCFEEYLETQTEDSEADTKLKWAIFDYFMTFELIDNSCDSLYDLSCLSWGEYYDCEGNRYVNLKNGYRTLISALLKAIPPTNIRLNSPVKTIQWTPEVPASSLRHYDIRKKIQEVKKDLQINGQSAVNSGSQEAPKKLVTVVMSDGSRYHSNHVVYTPSIGYTKQHYQELFQPGLPAKQEQALQKLGFGVIDKIFLEYESPWWEPGCRGIHMVWPDKQVNLPDLPDKPGDKMWHQWYKAISGFDTLSFQPRFLLAWLCGDNARYMETLTPEVVGTTCTQLLRYFTGKTDIPEPVSVFRSAWHSNPYIRGSYSYRSNKCDEIPCTAKDLADPVCSTVHHDDMEIQVPVLLVSGEGTHLKYYSTVHGAFHSGLDAAQALISWYQ